MIPSVFHNSKTSIFHEQPAFVISGFFFIPTTVPSFASANPINFRNNTDKRLFVSSSCVMDSTVPSFASAKQNLLGLTYVNVFCVGFSFAQLPNQ